MNIEITGKKMWLLQHSIYIFKQIMPTVFHLIITHAHVGVHQFLSFKTKSTASLSSPDR